MASGIYMYPDRHPTALTALGSEWDFIPPIEPLKLPVHRIGQFYSRATLRREGNGLLRFPILLSVATPVQGLRHHLSRAVS